MTLLKAERALTLWLDAAFGGRTPVLIQERAKAINPTRTVAANLLVVFLAREK
jgi:hypothetical protein